MSNQNPNTELQAMSQWTADAAAAAVAAASGSDFGRWTPVNGKF